MVSIDQVMYFFVVLISVAVQMETMLPRRGGDSGFQVINAFEMFDSRFFLGRKFGKVFWVACMIN